MGLEFSSTIQQLRHEKKLSQRVVAQDLGISQALLSHYEKGVRQPKLAFVRTIASYYGVSADDILGQPAGEHHKSKSGKRLQTEINSVLELVEEKFDRETAELACKYLSAAASNIRKIVEEPDCPYDPRRYLDMNSAEAALFDAAKSSGATK